MNRADFLAGQYFDIRLEVHAPVNGSEANGKLPDEHFTLTIAKEDGDPVPAAEYFEVEEAKLERWNFTWYEGRLWHYLSSNGDTNQRARFVRNG